jgi:hypothetical protein
MSIPAGSEVSSLLEKLKTEIRISLDYYERIFPNKKIDKMFYLCEQACYADLAVFSKDIGLPAHFVDVQRYAGKDIPFSLSFYKGYGASLSKAVRAYLKINILAKYEESRAKKAAVKLDSGSFLSGITLDSRALIAGVAICLVPYLYGFFRSVPIKKALAMAIIKRSSVATVDPNATLEDLGNIDSKYKEKINKWAQLISGQTYLTQIMEALPRILPRGSRITGFSFRNKGADNELSLQGIIYLGDRDREISTVNNLIKDLKTDTVFGKYFKSATINSLEHNPGGRPPTTSFSILLQ